MDDTISTHNVSFSSTGVSVCHRHCARKATYNTTFNYRMCCEVSTLQEAYFGWRLRHQAPAHLCRANCQRVLQAALQQPGHNQQEDSGLLHGKACWFMAQGYLLLLWLLLVKNIMPMRQHKHK